MLNVIAEHSVTLMTMIRAMAADPQAKPAAQNSDAEKPTAPGESTEAPSGPRTRAARAAAAAPATSTSGSWSKTDQRADARTPVD